jgi:Tfp pilus assembly protein PilF
MSDLHVRIAREHCSRGQPDETRVVLRKALRIDPEDEDALALSADLKAGRCQ